MDKELVQRIEEVERRLDNFEKLLGFTDEEMKQEALARFLEQRNTRREKWRQRSAERYEQ